jgi:hypothetical protein
MTAIIPLAPPLLTGSSNLPGRANGPFDQRPYLVLLHAGFGLPRLLPAARWALTPPFHPYPAFALSGSGAAVYFLCHFPSGRPARVLPGALPCGVRTFLSCQHFILANGYWQQRLPGSLQPIHHSPAKYGTARASCTNCCAAYRSPRQFSRCSNHSLSIWSRGTRARSPT